MTKRSRRIVFSLAAAAVVLLGFLTWYRVHYAMDPVEAA